MIDDALQTEGNSKNSNEATYENKIVGNDNGSSLYKYKKFTIFSFPIILWWRGNDDYLQNWNLKLSIHSDFCYVGRFRKSIINPILLYFLFRSIHFTTTTSNTVFDVIYQDTFNWMFQSYYSIPNILGKPIMVSETWHKYWQYPKGCLKNNWFDGKRFLQQCVKGKERIWNRLPSAWAIGYILQNSFSLICWDSSLIRQHV